MCNFRVLVQHADGYVVFCPDCNAFQLAFGTTLLRMRPEYFREFVLAIGRSGALCPETAGNVKNIFIPLEENTTLCLTQSERDKLDRLLREAAALFETFFILDQL
ncbi:DUF6686 family protein [Niabella beijingensis]|uniref:DUF6686 family protein n=1 Tax=Niabella beijingensis TaxID=2872700 RepID=UPI001CC1832E|nr:DUF6686 family protein [Niabella beijingensis]MBZ4191997.1 hypothetical protein [Niabella beijingensis]